MQAGLGTKRWSHTTSERADAEAFAVQRRFLLADRGVDDRARRRV